MFSDGLFDKLSIDSGKAKLGLSHQRTSHLLKQRIGSLRSTPVLSVPTTMIARKPGAVSCPCQKVGDWLASIKRFQSLTPPLLQARRANEYVFDSSIRLHNLITIYKPDASECVRLSRVAVISAGVLSNANVDAKLPVSAFFLVSLRSVECLRRNALAGASGLYVFLRSCSLVDQCMVE